MMEDSFKVPIFPAKPLQVEETSAEPEIPYKIPKWNGQTPKNDYSFEILKTGVIVDLVKDLQKRSFWMIGRLPVGTGVDISAAHPTVSRFHSVIQYKDSSSASGEGDEEVQSGWYVYDLDSTHGTFLNKMRIKPRTYVRLRVGHQLKLGNSTRSYILQGPSEDEDEESEFTVTELIEQKAHREAERKQKVIDDKLERERIAKEKEEAGIGWGMADDAEEEPDLSENPFAVTNNEELFLDDPKKTLRGFFEREGYDMEYKCDELSPGVFICRVELPIDDEYGKSIICEVQHKGKKKECVVQCALEACRILDRHGVLRQANHEPRRAKKIDNDDDSDDDTFFDRTGDVEAKRLKKMGTAPSEALTYEQLVEQEKEILSTIETNDKKLQQMIETEKRQKMQNDEDLDDFMNNLSNMDQKVDKFAISTIKMENQNLKTELQKIQKLVNIARPSISLPPIVQVKGKLPLFGKRSSLGRNFGIKKSETATETLEKVEKKEEFRAEEEEIIVEKSDTIEMQANEPADIDSKSPLSKPVEAPKVNEKEQVMEEQIPCKQETVPKMIESKTKKTNEEPAEKKLKLEDLASQPELTSSEPQSSLQDPSSKKRKTRMRNRNRLRENIDMNDDDEYIDEEKVSTWVAPDNQSGDGTTHLNDKYGY